jgi:hypothetical protein
MTKSEIAAIPAVHAGFKRKRAWHMRSLLLFGYFGLAWNQQIYDQPVTEAL